MKVALLDLRVREKMFVGSNDAGALAAALTGQGHAVKFVRSVQESEPRGPEAWRAGLTALVREGGFELVAVTRAWDADTVAALRSGLEAGAKLVRLTEGVAAALDEKFDHVVDQDGLYVLASGHVPDNARWKPTNAKEIRELRRQAPTLTVVTQPPVIQQVESGGSKVARAVLHGPAGGCPFLLDTTKNPVFAGLDMPRDEIQTRGCSFCLDNTGAYAVPAEAEVVNAWMAGWRTAKAADASLRELLLTDERPHPYLPGLLRALIAERAGPLEILWKSRVDWLLEFADGPITEALTLARDAGIVLHLYLIGFEAFDQFHLDLFNKGVTVADNLRAVEKVRELAGRFPSAFEYRKHRAHGFVLFTPWTKPAHVIENARAMRAHRLDEFRSEAFKTRLRLYPRVPLHAMALRDGLVADKFDESRPDRAIEQGYDASVPWRFQDGATEALFEAVQKLMSRPGQRPEEADVLEITAEYMQRWPGLANAPDVAHLPLAHTLDTKGDPYTMAREGAAVLAAYDLELEGIRAGDRSACLKENVKAADAEGFIRAMRAMGFAAGVAGRHGFVAGADAHTAGSSHCVIAVARDDATLERAQAIFAAHSTDKGPGPIREMAVLLGYPACCAEAFATNPARGDNLENERAMFRRAPGAALDPLLNRYARTRLLSHFPCRPDCAESVTVAARVLERMGALSERGAEWTRAQLGTSVLFVDYERKALVRGRWEHGAYVIEQWTRYGDEWQGVAASSIQAVRLRPNGLDFMLKDGATRALNADGAFIVEPGKPLSPESWKAMAAHVAGTGERSSSGGPNAPSGSPADPAAFRTLLLGAEALPVVLAGGLRIDDVRAPRTGGRIELVCGRDDGDALLATFELQRAGAPSYAKTKHLALSYRTPPADLAPQRVKAALDALRTRVESAEARADASAVTRIFRPEAS